MLAYTAAGPIMSSYGMGMNPYYYNSFSRFRYGYGPNYGLGYPGAGYMPYAGYMGGMGGMGYWW